MPGCKLESSQEQDTRPAAPGILLRVQTMKHAGTMTDGQLLSGDAGVPVDDTKLILWQESRNAGGGHKAGCDMTIRQQICHSPQTLSIYSPPHCGRRYIKQLQARAAYRVLSVVCINNNFVVTMSIKPSPCPVKSDIVYNSNVDI